MKCSIAFYASNTFHSNVIEQDHYGSDNDIMSVWHQAMGILSFRPSGTESIPKLNGAAIEVWERGVFSSHTLPDMWLFIHAGIKWYHISKRGPKSQ